MTTIVTRASKGAPLTSAELDANFTNLNTDKTENAAVRPIANGGTGQSTAQAALDALTQAAAAANETILTKDTATGNAVFKAAPTSAGAALNVANLWSAAQRVAIITLTDAPTITADMSLSNNFSVTLAGSRILGNPTNLVAGQGGSIRIDRTGAFSLTFDTYWKFTGGAPAGSSTAGAIDRRDYFVWSATEIHAALAVDVK